MNMIMSENIDIFKSDSKPPHVTIGVLKNETIAESRETREDFNSNNNPRKSQAAALLDAEKNGNDDLIETDDELLEVGSNEGPDGSEEDDEDDEDLDDGDNSNISRPLDFTTGRKLSDSGMLSSHYYKRILSKLNIDDF